MLALSAGPCAGSRAFRSMHTFGCVACDGINKSFCFYSSLLLPSVLKASKSFCELIPSDNYRVTSRTGVLFRISKRRSQFENLFQRPARLVSPA